MHFGSQEHLKIKAYAIVLFFGVNCGGFELNREWQWILQSQTRDKDHLFTPLARDKYRT